MSGTHHATALAGLLVRDELVLLMGPPGAGKDTHAERLAQDTHAVCRSTGQLLREANDPVLNDIMASGGLVPEADLQRVLASAIEALSGKPIILSGATKKPKEAAWLLETLSQIDRRLLVVIQLEVDEATALQRITQANRGRADDNPAVQYQRRLEFDTETRQSLKVYHQVGLLQTVDASADSDRVYEQVLDVVRSRRDLVDSQD